MNKYILNNLTYIKEKKLIPNYVVRMKDSNYVTYFRESDGRNYE